MAEQGISVGALEEAAGELRRDGATAIFIGIDGRPAGSWPSRIP